MKCASLFLKLLSKYPLWTLAKSTDQNFNNRLVIYPSIISWMGLLAAYVAFTQKNEL